MLYHSARRISGFDRTVQGIESVAPNLGQNKLDAESETQSQESPDEATDGRSDESSKDSPVLRVQTLTHEQKVGSHLGITVVDGAKDEDGENAAQAADDDLKAAPEVEVVGEADAEDGNRGCRQEIADEVDLQDRGRFKGQHHDGDDDEYNEATDDPDVEAVAEEIVGGG